MNILVVVILIAVAAAVLVGAGSVVYVLSRKKHLQGQYRPERERRADTAGDDAPNQTVAGEVTVKAGPPPAHGAPSEKAGGDWERDSGAL
ncbi:hypothetical protein LJB76_03175 [Clostridia bacterium OttesenSCG-928-O13]|nr:hypothetical protein [Clostridia bacterium OttesenSCG-928-O13]